MGLKESPLLWGVDRNLDPVEPDDADEDGRHWADDEPIDEDEGYDDYWDDETDYPEDGDTLMQEIMEMNLHNTGD